MHPSAEIRGSKSQLLSGKKIVLGVSGSIAAVETVKLARELLRHGAEVIPVMTEAATRILHPDALWFATGSEPVTKLTGAVEHVALCGEVSGRADLLLVAPATANTISKMALGIDDTPVTTCATTAIGSGMPVLVAPAMHLSMYKHPAVMENVARLKGMGVEFVDPWTAERKAKLAGNDELVAAVCRALLGKPLEGKRVLVIMGSTAESIDDIRVVTNRSSGGTGLALAKAAYELGADVEIWTGWHSVSIPMWLKTERFESVAHLLDMAEEITHDVVFMPVAVSDYTPKKASGKLPSGKKTLTIQMTRTPKVITLVRKKCKGKLIGFKAETGITKKELLAKAKKRLDEFGLDVIVANDVRDVNAKGTRVQLLRKGKKPKELKGSKDAVAHLIFAELAKGK